ncbi:MAG: M28 family peptidase [Gammaproteobacteria bacterium]|nr:M28 family peptidase [Gammaproteobacteria bacterium]MBU1477840.1 M28 family peptidase [Gammaproteobacteria bacterium]MBU2001171.1 M28 family peptidase [Gammaproteobacteria bacterium]MBU2132493.1 M28 family peptidase [Gammaproteobacteria bacterium]MBU2189366.1 M28 family peptidase [Gammaproteobacteria bacterium]
MRDSTQSPVTHLMLPRQHQSLLNKNLSDINLSDINLSPSTQFNHSRIGQLLAKFTFMHFIRYQFQRLGLLALACFVATTLTGCASSPETCARTELKLTWAEPLELQAIVTRLSSDKFEGRKTQTPGAEKSRDYIKQQFQGLGLQPWGADFIVPFEYQTFFTQENGANVVATAMATEPTNRWRIIVAHYDHLGMSGSKIYHGADDNASGVAAMLAIAKHWQQQFALQSNTLPKVNLMFVATDAEEPGLYGSIALVEQLKTRLPEATFELMLNLDMVSHPGRPYAIYLEGSRNFTQFTQFKPLLNQQNRLCIKLSHPKPVGRSIQSTDWLRASDHYSFHKANIPWLYFGVPTHPQYHTPEDTVATIDITFLAAVTESAFELLQLNAEYLKN